MEISIMKKNQNYTRFCLGSVITLNSSEIFDRASLHDLKHFILYMKNTLENKNNHNDVWIHSGSIPLIPFFVVQRMLCHYEWGTRICPLLVHVFI